MMKKEIKISCPNKCDWVTYNLDEFLLRPGAEFGIDKARFIVLPNVFCLKCNAQCNIELIQTATETRSITTAITVKLI